MQLKNLNLQADFKIYCSNILEFHFGGPFEIRSSYFLCFFKSYFSIKNSSKFPIESNLYLISVSLQILSSRMSLFKNVSNRKSQFVFTFKEMARQYLLRDTVIDYMIQNMDSIYAEFTSSVPTMMTTVCAYIQVIYKVCLDNLMCAVSVRYRKVRHDVSNQALPPGSKSACLKFYHKKKILRSIAHSRLENSKQKNTVFNIFSY